MILLYKIELASLTPMELPNNGEERQISNTEDTEENFREDYVLKQRH
jgi:hypothetical protein